MNKDKDGFRIPTYEELEQHAMSNDQRWYDKYNKLEQQLNLCVKVLKEIRNDSKLWKKSGGAGGADMYLGLPPAMRIIDEALRRLEDK